MTNDTVGGSSNTSAVGVVGVKLGGRSALITGGTQGLGLEVARQYLRAGIGGVSICGRDSKALQEACSELTAACGEDQQVIAQTADVSKTDDVLRLVETTLAHFPQLTILVNNAGVYGPKGRVDESCWEEWTRAIEINLMGSVLTARTLVPHFVQQGYGKIIQLSGGGATKPMPGISAYAASKAGVVRFAETLAEELRAHRVDVNAIAPGALNTRMLDEVLSAGPDKVGPVYFERAQQQQRSGGVPLERAAALAVWLASGASDGITAKLLSAVWDPWPELIEHCRDLSGDVYTLRRIVPGDRGMDWGDG
jgi:NAD(P)-dependent dehydrogenase (short-subunit alcohol dehydrogenase family)